MDKITITMLLRNERKRKGLSLKDVSDQTGISYQILSRYERGQEFPTKERLGKILKCLQLNIDGLDETVHQIDRLFDEFMNDQFNRKLNDDEYEKVIQVNKEKFEHYGNYYKILVMEYIIRLFAGKDEELIELEKQIERMNHHDLRVRQIYLDYKGFHLLLKKKTSEGVELLEKAKYSYYDEKTIAMINYHLCFAYDLKHLKRNGIERIEEAMAVFKKYEAYKRIADCYFLKGNFLAYQRKYDKAMEVYENALRLMKLVNDPKSSFASLYRTMGYVQLLNKRYDDVINWLELASQIEPNHVRMHLYYVWTYYCLGNISKACLWITKTKRLSLTKIENMIVQLFDMMIKNENRMPTKRMVSKAEKIYHYYKAENDTMPALFYLEILVELLERRNNYETAFTFQKEIIELLNEV